MARRVRRVAARRGRCRPSGSRRAGAGTTRPSRPRHARSCSTITTCCIRDRSTPTCAAASRRTGLPEELIYAIIRQESLFRADAASSAGAIGLMQLLPETARTTARRAGLPEPTRAQLVQPAVNIPLGSEFLASLVQRFDGETAAGRRRLQRRAECRAALATGCADGPRRLGREHPVQRNARLRAARGMACAGVRLARRPQAARGRTTGSVRVRPAAPTAVARTHRSEHPARFTRRAGPPFGDEITAGRVVAIGKRAPDRCCLGRGQSPPQAGQPLVDRDVAELQQRDENGDPVQRQAAANPVERVAHARSHGARC